MIGDATPTRRIAAALAALAALALAACGEDEAAPAAADAGARSRPKATAAPPDSPAIPEEKGEAAPGVLAAGRHAVYGLRMPQGMLPAGAPSPGVYRFEGPHPAAIVTAFITEQLASFDPPAAEPAGKLYRNAVVRKPIGGVAPEPLALRLHEQATGTVVDVWLEKRAGTPGTASVPDPFAVPGAQPQAQQRPAGSYGTPTERRRAVFEMLQKIERGEPITERDLDNPLFQ
jgi:hypothetical protein